jgi:hypothetical protein
MLLGLVFGRVGQRRAHETDLAAMCVDPNPILIFLHFGAKR